MVRLASAPQPKPLVVRVDEVGPAEAVAYEAMEAQADPLDPTTGFVVDQYLRRRGTVREYWERSRGFLTPQVANAAYAEQAEDVAATGGGAAGGRTAGQGRHRTDPAATRGAAHRGGDVRLGARAEGEEVAPESWSDSMRFSFLPEIPAELVVRNPIGIMIWFLQPTPS